MIMIMRGIIIIIMNISRGVSSCHGYQPEMQFVMFFSGGKITGELGEKLGTKTRTNRNPLITSGVRL